jgi:hypothetical protein
MRVISFVQAKARYVHRFTMDHRPQWAIERARNGKFYAPQFRSDREWYDNTLFPGEAHVHPRERHCFTTGQTWPLGVWLDQPFARTR